MSEAPEYSDQDFFEGLKYDLYNLVLPFFCPDQEGDLDDIDDDDEDEYDESYYNSPEYEKKYGEFNKIFDFYLYHSDELDVQSAYDYIETYLYYTSEDDVKTDVLGYYLFRSILARHPFFRDSGSGLVKKRINEEDIEMLSQLEKEHHFTDLCLEYYASEDAYQEIMDVKGAVFPVSDFSPKIRELLHLEDITQIQNYLDFYEDETPDDDAKDFYETSLDLLVKMGTADHPVIQQDREDLQEKLLDLYKDCVSSTAQPAQIKIGKPRKQRIKKWKRDNTSYRM